MSGIDRATAQWYVDTALAKLLARADELADAGGDELLSRRPDVEGANSVYAIVSPPQRSMTPQQWTTSA